VRFVEEIMALGQDFLLIRRSSSISSYINAQYNLLRVALWGRIMDTWGAAVLQGQSYLHPEKKIQCTVCFPSAAISSAVQKYLLSRRCLKVLYGLKMHKSDWINHDLDTLIFTSRSLLSRCRGELEAGMFRKVGAVTTSIETQLRLYCLPLVQSCSWALQSWVIGAETRTCHDL
jgi:hypothetical protein